MVKGVNPAWIAAIVTAGMIGGGIWTAIGSKKGNLQSARTDAGITLRDAVTDAAKDVPMAFEDLSGRVRVTLPQTTADLCDLATRTCTQATKLAK